MYHKFSNVEKDEWTRSFENFYCDLLYNGPFDEDVEAL